ncbi:DUF6234 family protein [Streptomyces cyaneofuscatus]|uniref:DUF6234 family protein n=1 Tax=Streptomyces cyaneofuscatus TaxID=66883 RepID=A0ABZ1F0E0_9ACTN|nr:DUF6234 family protein [Streptomyces cyaneofuscatus]WSB09796.1 DUF6234 family protein [Streptomyces cyaneofuscatus]WSD46671.1 DUF6234 family protein [Streptomyces cyaneofuscatus]WTA90045.1 DUF6234 family protein [Streptomyces cyaneofuscatus]
MTHPERRLPGRPAERGGAAGRPPAPGGCADPLLGLFLVVAEVTVCVPLFLGLGLRAWARSSGTAHAKGSPPPADPGTDWVPLAVLGVLALAVALVAVPLLRGRWLWAGGMQVIVALVLCAAALASAGGGEAREEPPNPAPTWNSPPCRSGGNSDECARSGG